MYKYSTCVTLYHLLQIFLPFVVFAVIMLKNQNCRRHLLSPVGKNSIPELMPGLCKALGLKGVSFKILFVFN